MSSIQVVFSDIDGTLIRDDHQPSAYTISVIQALQDKNIPLILVSARMPNAMYPIQQALGIHAPLIAYGGAYVEDEKGHTIAQQVLDFEQACTIKKDLEHRFPTLVCNAYGAHDWVVENRMLSCIQEEESIVKTQAKQASICEFFAEKPLHKFLYMGEPSLIAQARDYINDAYPDCLASLSKDTLMEVVDKRVTKSFGIRAFCEYKSLDPSQAIAFGDSHNDLPMLECVGFGYLMKNAHDELFHEGLYRTNYTHNEDGVAHTLADLLLS